jgi:hypothetical protein
LRTSDVSAQRAEPYVRSWLRRLVRQAAPPTATAPAKIPPKAAKAPARAKTCGAWVSYASHHEKSFQGA